MRAGDRISRGGEIVATYWDVESGRKNLDKRGNGDVKQGIAEWYVTDLVEKSRRGMEQSVLQGWHTGGPPPYSYKLEEHPHPNPHKAHEGKKKHRLVPDPVGAPIVRMIFEEYCINKVGLGEICDKLNSDVARYPPPGLGGRNGDNAAWNRSQLQTMLRNPKYTGFNVWGRRDKRSGQPTLYPREQWVWSPEPTHEPLITRELFDLVEDRARSNEKRARQAPRTYPTRSTSRNGRLYPLRGRVRCAICGRRMEGSHQRNANWYHCRFKDDRAGTVTDHPRALQIKEERVLEGVFYFMGRRLFGPQRIELLRDELSESVAKSWQDHDTEVTALRSELDQIDTALYRQALRLEEHDDPKHPVIALAKRRIEELSTRRKVIAERIRDHEEHKPDSFRPEEIEALLEAIPDLRERLATASPEDLAEILKAFDVCIVYDKRNRTIKLAATISTGLSFDKENTRRSDALSGISREVAGAGFGHLPATSYRFVDLLQLPEQYERDTPGELCVISSGPRFDSGFEQAMAA